MRKILKIFVFLGWLMVLGALVSFEAKAAISSCSATVSPTSVTTYSSNGFSFSVENTDSSDVSWIKITRPSGNFEIVGGGVSGWGMSSDESTITLTGGTLSSGGTQAVNATVQVTGGTAASSADWTVQVSDDSGGASPFNCTGTLGTEITSGGTDTYAPTLSSLAVTSVGDTAITITWTTDEAANGVIQYGSTSSYGSTQTDASLITDHSITIGSLTANATYHFKVQSTDSAGNTAESSDNTFVTAQESTTVTVTQTTTVTETVTKLIDDTTKPSATITTDLSEPYEQVPTILGSATDNAGVASVEYSVDNGQNWLPVDSTSNLRSKSVGFEFAPVGLLDGNYKIKIRTTDLTGNTTISKLYTLIYDRLPPLVGGSLISIGSQILEPGSKGEVYTIAGVDQKVTLSAIGGPTEIDILVGLPETKTSQNMNSVLAVGTSYARVLAAESQLFSLTKNFDNGLWSGTLSFSSPGVYQLVARSVDGAGTETVRNLNRVVVLGGGKVAHKDKEVTDASVYVYYQEPVSKRFVLWDGEAYGQKNPQSVSENGEYKTLLPPGKYYLEVVASGFRTQRTNIFSTQRVFPVTTDFSLDKKASFFFGVWKISSPDLFQPLTKVELDPVLLPEVEEPGKSFVGQELPYFRLQTQGSDVTSFDFRGKPVVLSFANTWLPQTTEQIRYLDSLARETRFSTVLIVPQESASSVQIYRELGGYEILMIADVDGELMRALELYTFPAYVFVDRKGIVQNIELGLLDEEEIIKNIY